MVDLGKNSLISVGLSPFKSVISCFHVPLSALTISVDVFLSFFRSGIKTGFLDSSLTLMFPSIKFDLTTLNLDDPSPAWGFRCQSNPILQKLQHHRRWQLLRYHCLDHSFFQSNLDYSGWFFCCSEPRFSNESFFRVWFIITSPCLLVYDFRYCKRRKYCI